MSSRRVTTLAAVATAATASLLLAACGSSSGGGSSSSAAAPSSSSAAPSSSSAAPSPSESSSSAAPAPALPKTLVFSPVSLAPPALKGLSEGLKGLAGSQGWETIVQDPNFDPQKQNQQLNEVLESGRAGAFWVIAVAPKTMGEFLKNAQSKGVPVLTNGKPEEYGYTGAQPGITFDYIDYTAAGTALGEQTGKCIAEKLGGNGNVLYATSQAGTAGKEEFDKSALDALKKAAPNVKVQEVVVIDRAKGQTEIGNALQGNPDLNAVMSNGDEGALGALGAFEAAGKELACDIDFGGNDEVLAAVKAGKIYASVALQFQADVGQSFETLVKMQADPTAPGLILTVPQKVVTQQG